MDSTAPKPSITIQGDVTGGMFFSYSSIINMGSTSNASKETSTTTESVMKQEKEQNRRNGSVNTRPVDSPVDPFLFLTNDRDEFVRKSAIRAEYLHERWKSERSPTEISTSKDYSEESDEPDYSSSSDTSIVGTPVISRHSCVTDLVKHTAQSSTVCHLVSEFESLQLKPKKEGTELTTSKDQGPKRGESYDVDSGSLVGVRRSNRSRTKTSRLQVDAMKNSYK